MNTTNSRELVTVATYWDPMEAQIARLRLAHEGIPAFLEKEFMVMMAWHYTNAVGGIRLAVPLVNYDQAERLLRIKEVFSDWSNSRCWEPSLNGIPVLSEDEEQAVAGDQEFRQPMTAREALADRAFRAAVLGLCWEIAFLFACGHLWRFYTTEGRCRPEFVRKARWAWWFTGLIAVTFLLLIVMAWDGLALERFYVRDDQARYNPPINAVRP